MHPLSEGKSIWRSAPVPHPHGTALTPNSTVATQGTGLGTRLEAGPAGTSAGGQQVWSPGQLAGIATGSRAPVGFLVGPERPVVISLT